MRWNIRTSLTVFAALAMVTGSAAAQQLLPNPSFTEGNEAPAGWTLQGRGRWLDRSVLEASGNGRESSAWHCPVELRPGALYRLECVARRAGGGDGCMTSGPSFANRDHRPTDAWQTYGHVFQVPSHGGHSGVRIGQWHVDGAIQVRSARLLPVLPVHVQTGEWVLGEDESIREGVYRFQTRFRHEGSNYHRTLHRATAGFNSNRWTFGRGQEVVYQFALPETTLRTAQVRFGVCYYQGGRVVLDVSRDGENWHVLTEQADLGAAEAVVPEALLPAKKLYLRLRTPDEPSTLQVDHLEFTAELDSPAPELVGQTLFAEVLKPSSDLQMDRITLESAGGSGPQSLRIEGHQAGQGDVSATLNVEIEHPDGRRTAPVPAGVQLDGGRPAEFHVPLPSLPAGESRLHLTLTAGDLQPWEAGVDIEVPDYYRTDYGALLDDTNAAAVWWCRAGHKIPRQRAVPTRHARAAELAAAKNDYEAVQLVVKAEERPLVGLSAEAGPLAGPEGAVIDAGNIELLRVYYHYVDTPTDHTGVRDWWPDALPPLDEPIDVPAGQNQPIWVLVHVPEEAAAGEYTGTVTLRAEGFSAEVPLRLRVWDFALPQCNKLETAFGLNFGNIVRYHRLETEADRRAVWEEYLALMSRSRLSPYDPTPMDPIRVDFRPDADPPRAELDFEAFDREFARVIEKHHFTNFRLRVQGMGGGTFHSRVDPSIGPYRAGTRQYEATFADYVGQFESHLHEKGWLEMAYVYWFDEPAPKDYEFVADGMKRLKRYAPDLPRMLTEQPADNVLAGTVDIWCPVSHAYDPEEAAEARGRGERFWWYVCTGPKAPYCTLFIDHPATELRVWHWQTWQRDIEGTLVWSANYWTSSAAYPDNPQNPYEDPMGWRSGYSTPKGEKRPWGNGDGRFVYPPLSAATPEIAGEGPVLDPPVSSIRLEMLREGVEDYEMLHLLRTLLAKHGEGRPADERARYEWLLEVPPEITADMTTFTTSPEPIHARRAEIAAAIERLVREAR